MSERIEMQANCLCGAVRATAKPDIHIHACHCQMCRRWGGGPFFALDCGGDVAFSGEQNIGVFDSSDWAERGFCKKCGSHLFYRLKQNRHHMIPAGLFARDAAEKLILHEQIFIDEKPNYYAFANDTEKLTCTEVFARASAE